MALIPKICLQQAKASTMVCIENEYRSSFHSCFLAVLFYTNANMLDVI